MIGSRMNDMFISPPLVYQDELQPLVLEPLDEAVDESESPGPYVSAGQATLRTRRAPIYLERGGLLQQSCFSSLLRDSAVR